MILIDVIDAERRKIVAALSPGTDEGPGPSRRPQASIQPEQPVEAPSPEPPDYDTSEAQVKNLKAIDIEKPTNRSQKRLRRFLVYGLVVYLVLSVSVGIPLFVVLRRNAQAEAIENQEMWMKAGGLPPPLPLQDGLPPDVSNLPAVFGSPIQCNNWTRIAASGSDPPYYKLQYSMPLSNTLYIRSNISDTDDDDDFQSIIGGLRVSVTNDASQSNATVTVMMKDTGEDALEDSRVCLMGTNSTWGLAITIPDDADEKKRFLDINLVLPLTQNGSPLCNLVTYLPSFNQTFDSLDSYMTLDTLDVEGTSGSIYFESAHARSILVKASDSSITGNFNATDKIILETILQPITANVSLYNDGIDYDPTTLNVETGNSTISVNVYLRSFANGSEYCLPNYMTSLNTFSGAIDANYYHDSSLVASTLFIRAYNAMDPARIFVDRVFQGTYDIHTSLANAIVDRTTDVIDPSGAGRSRTFEDTYVSSSRAYGWVGWGQRPVDRRILQQGHIEVVSRLSPAILQLTEVPDTNALTSSKSSKPIDSRL